MKKTLLALITFLSLNLLAQTYSTGNGNWNATGPWDTGVIPPDNGDTVFIEAGTTISINSNTTYANSLVIVVRGTFTLNQTLTLASGSQIVIEPGGLVNSGNNGWRLDIGAMSWKDFKKDPHTGGILTDGVLSVKEIDFDVKYEDDILLIDWGIIEGDDKVLSVELQKSVNGVDFENIALFEVDELRGNEKLGIDIKENFVYFRLKVIDEKDVTYSKILKVENDVFELKVYPNPFRDKVFVNSNLDEFDTEIKLIDILGNVVKQDSNITLLNTENLESGIYFVHVYQNNQLVKNSRMMKK